MDGNGRWAQAHYLPRLEGHRVGVSALKRIVRACPDYHVKYLTVYAFSSENWNRPKHEVNGLIDLVRRFVVSEVDELHREAVCLKVIGDKNRFPEDLQSLLTDAEQKTSPNKRFYLNVALNYGGQQDIVQACIRGMTSLVERGGVLTDFSAKDIEQHLSTFQTPKPHFIIRTSGEKRLSNFLLWEAAYSELFFIDKYWPDFNPDDLRECIEGFRKRQRRFGRLV